MAASAGFSGKIQFSVDDSTYYDVAGMNSASYDIGRGKIEITAFGDTAPNAIAGLKTFKGEASGYYSDADTNGQVALLSAMLNGTDAYIKCLPDGTNGYKAKVIITSAKSSASAGDEAAKFSFSWENIAAPTAV